ncbi:MAG: cobyric acid synthase [Synergistaceae bacterium]|nr:cobyric acid synthase [Synergistaceae bacterium]
MNGIMIQGTSSGAGKSFIVTGLCRLLSDMGIKVCPFKSQNMSNNAYITHDGLEISTAQATQAQAARLTPECFMNPILLKPRHNTSSEIILNGRTYAHDTSNYREFALNEGMKAIRESLAYIAANFEAVIIEGAGSPAEINLNDSEIVNMRIAREADVPVILVADVGKGGSLASVAGTLDLLGDDRKRVKGIIYNMFRGDMSLFDDAVKWTENYTGVKVVGVVPFIEGARIAPEDSLNITDYHSTSTNQIRIGVLRFPNIANFSDLSAFAHEADVSLRYIDGNISVCDFFRLDVVIFPHTNNIKESRKWLYESGLGKVIRIFGGALFGIGGGMEILRTIRRKRIEGTNVTSIFRNDDIRSSWLNRLRRTKNYGEHGIIDTPAANNDSFDEIARVMSQSLDVSYILKISGMKL